MALPLLWESIFCLWSMWLSVWMLKSQRTSLLSLTHVYTIFSALHTLKFLPMNIPPNLIVHSLSDKIRHADTKWSTVSTCYSHNLHIGSALFFIRYAWKHLVNRFWVCAAIINTSVSTFNPTPYWWLSCLFTSEPFISGCVFTMQEILFIIVYIFYCLTFVFCYFYF